MIFVRSGRSVLIGWLKMEGYDHVTLLTSVATTHLPGFHWDCATRMTLELGLKCRQYQLEVSIKTSGVEVVLSPGYRECF